MPTRLLPEPVPCCDAELNEPPREPDPELCVGTVVGLSVPPVSGLVVPVVVWPPVAMPPLPLPPLPPPARGCAKLLEPMRPELLRVEGVEFCCELVGLQMQTHCPDVPSWGAR